MNKVLTTAIGIIALFIFAQIGFAALTASESEASPVVSVEPEYLKVSHGNTFTVNITINPANEEIHGAQFKLYFNNALLNATLLSQGTFFSGFNTIPFGEGINNTAGMIDYGEAVMGDEGVNNSGVFVFITFEVIGTSGVSDLKLRDVILVNDTGGLFPDVNNGTVEIEAPSTPFLIYGHVIYENGFGCNNPGINITNLNSGAKWEAETNAGYNYYQLVLTPCTDIVAGETLQFNVTSPDGSQSNITNYTITQDDINNGGLFNFNITLEAKPGIFDTGAPDSPYPSIMGVHNGTIKPNQAIAVNRIYTYACPGTGGHIEYARIWGNGVDAYANWSGYAGDWHNLTFNTTFTLEPGKEYNYTIRTGSYPQIIHHHGEYNATGGKIICDEFTDANGKKYEGWIPAIKLWWEEE